ncbi:hypothetical protein PF007_g23250 [Phytophthora fragariae]|uniref:Uncharacterized protein n=1 Tax=Phytophthora fragariae TaxID=53985 RepID=A0A6A3QPF2_9STRA|nr:hypothetical protein PF007_g23250 [Phytophthora fragariae]
MYREGIVTNSIESTRLIVTRHLRLRFQQISIIQTQPNGYYTCDMARDFSEFGYHSVKYEHTPVAPSLALPYVATSKRQPTNSAYMGRRPSSSHGFSCSISRSF